MLQRRMMMLVPCPLLLVLLLLAGSASAFAPAAVPFSQQQQRRASLNEILLLPPPPPPPPISSRALLSRGSSSPPPTPTSLKGAADDLLDIAATSSELGTYFLKTLITNGVPAVFTIIVIAYAAKLLVPKRDKRGRGDDEEVFDNYDSPAAALYRDLYGDQQQKKSPQDALRQLFGGGGGGSGRGKRGRGGDLLDDSQLPKNVGVPREQYFRIEHYNRKLDSYQYSLGSATAGKAEAAAQYRQSSFESALRKAFPTLTANQWQHLQKLERGLLKEGTPLVDDLLKVETQLVRDAADASMGEMGIEQVYQLDPAGSAESNTTLKTTNKSKPRDGKHKKKDKGTLDRQARNLRSQLEHLELKFVQEVLQVVGPEAATAVRTAWVGDVATRGLGRLLLSDIPQRPLTAVLLGSGNHQSDDAAAIPNGNNNRPPVLYVTRFPGDATASQVANLREEVTAILRNASPGNDEVLVVLKTGGGTVTGYGLAAAQLLRLKQAKVPLTVAVEQVAASGGYMMCCVADRIVASPFAVLGSIGVISDIPNVYNRLKTEGIEFQTVTAGKYKRTLTPTKKVTPEDFAKTKQDVEDIFILFRDFVAQNRPQLDIESVATGETWFGSDALERKLCDEIKTVDDVMGEYVDRGYDVYEVEYSPPDQSPLGRFLPRSSSSIMDPLSQQDRGPLGRAVGWLVRIVAAEVRSELMRDVSGAELGGGASLNPPPLQERYVAQNDDAERKRTEA